MNRHINMNLVYEHSITQRDINLKNSRTGFLCFIFFFTQATVHLVYENGITQRDIKLENDNLVTAPLTPKP